jgi:hypothetical protein
MAARTSTQQSTINDFFSALRVEPPPIERQVRTLISSPGVSAFGPVSDPDFLRYRLRLTINARYDDTNRSNPQTRTFSFRRPISFGVASRAEVISQLEPEIQEWKDELIGLFGWADQTIEAVTADILGNRAGDAVATVQSAIIKPGTAMYKSRAFQDLPLRRKVTKYDYLPVHDNDTGEKNCVETYLQSEYGNRRGFKKLLKKIATYREEKSKTFGREIDWTPKSILNEFCIPAGIPFSALDLTGNVIEHWTPEKRKGGRYKPLYFLAANDHLYPCTDKGVRILKITQGSKTAVERKQAKTDEDKARADDVKDNTRYNIDLSELKPGVGRVLYTKPVSWMSCGCTSDPCECSNATVNPLAWALHKIYAKYHIVPRVKYRSGSMSSLMYHNSGIEITWDPFHDIKGVMRKYLGEEDVTVGYSTMQNTLVAKYIDDMLSYKSILVGNLRRSVRGRAPTWTWTATTASTGSTQTIWSRTTSTRRTRLSSRTPVTTGPYSCRAVTASRRTMASTPGPERTTSRSRPSRNTCS